VRVLYERGAFTATDTQTVAAILAVFGLGLPAFVLIKAFTPGYFAREDTRTPMYFAGISVAVNIGTALTLFPTLGPVGIATAAAVAGWLNAAMLLAMLVRRGHWGRDAALLSRIPRLVLSAALMAGTLWYGISWSGAWLASSSPLHVQALALAGLVGVGAIVYFAAAFALGGADRSMIRRSIARRGQAAPPVDVE